MAGKGKERLEEIHSETLARLSKNLGAAGQQASRNPPAMHWSKISQIVLELSTTNKLNTAALG